MKKWIALVLAALMALPFAGCTGEQKTPKTADIMSSIRSEIEFPEMAEKTVDDLPGYGYDLSADDVKQMSYIIATSGLTPEEVFIVEAKDEATAAKIEEMMKTRRDQIADLASTYSPEEMDKINKAVIMTKGSYAYYAVTGDNSKAKKLFEAAF